MQRQIQIVCKPRQTDDTQKVLCLGILLLAFRIIPFISLWFGSYWLNTINSAIRWERENQLSSIYCLFRIQIFCRWKNTVHIAIPSDKVFHNLIVLALNLPLWDIVQVLRWNQATQIIQESGKPGIYYKV